MIKKKKKQNWGQALPLAVYADTITGKNVKGTKKVVSKNGVSSVKTVR